MGVDAFVLGGRLAQGAIAAAALAFQQHRQRATHADEPGRQAIQYRRAIRHPVRFYQDVIGDNIRHSSPARNSFS